ncbi:MAG: hypothetical protein WAV09_01145 [Minisyncoccia bacterium]
MATQTQKKFYKYAVNGETYYDAVPDTGNVPSGYTPITAQEFVTGGEAFRARHPVDGSNYVTDANLALARSVTPSATGAGQSGYEIVNGVPQKVGTEAAKAQEQADIASGKLVQIGTSPTGQPLYAPAGSPATQARLQTNQPAPLGSTERTNQLLAEASQQTGIPAQQFQTNQAPQTSQTTQGGAASQLPTAENYGLTGQNAQTFDLLKGYLEKLTTNGQSINPNVEITPERVSEFMKQAQSNIDEFIPYASKEIKPFYENQLKIAREGFLRSAGYSQQQLVEHEAELERKFSETQKGIGESAAESGFAQSGMRFRQERENVDATQRALGQARSQVGNQVTGLASTFAQNFGTANLPQMNIGSTPQVGDNSFTRNGSSPFYQLSPETYNGLKGEQEFGQEAAIRSRAAELENAFRSSQATAQQRKLTLS